MDSSRGLRSSVLTAGLVGCLLWGLAPIAQAQSLWKGTQVGMSVTAIQRQFPRASAPPAPTRLTDGSRELLRLADTPVQGHAFDALFFFRQGALQHVNLELRETGGAVFALQTFRSIKVAFDAKYGPPVDEQDQTFNAATGTATFRSASWRSGRTLITLSYATAAGRLVVMNVAYRPAPSRSTDDI
ncbi:hypothetical protein ASD53_06020 [Lysobacter sp. Root559]|uniref:hypothetical protein n=1 Tax=Lysobacter sp. Root559 TaxID=1736559 RepID=UPI0006F64547|nr:hypothetical protein [Lysobacter sp. Root559]KQZ59133.1 hypothetical protein ASD53_06020 [Lysobacter sp. Root559]